MPETTHTTCYVDVMPQFTVRSTCHTASSYAEDCAPFSVTRKAVVEQRLCSNQLHLAPTCVVI